MGNMVGGFSSLVLFVYVVEFVLLVVSVLYRAQIVSSCFGFFVLMCCCIVGEYFTFLFSTFRGISSRVTFDHDMLLRHIVG